MKWKSALVTSASGSVGGLTASRNAGGAYYRARVVPTNPNSTFQQAVRAAMSNLTSRWLSTLTDAQRAAWKAYSDNVPLIDRLGDPRNVGALPMYIRSNVPRIQAGLSIVDDGPTTFNLGDFTAPSFTATVLGTAIGTVFTNADEWANEDGAAMLVFQSRAQSPSINYFKGPYRLAGQVLGDSGTPPTSPQADAAVFPFAADQRVYFRAVVTRADGRLSSDFLSFAVAA